MVSVNNNYTTEYELKTQTASSSKETPAVNSVYDVEKKVDNTNNGTPIDTSRLDKVLEEVAKKFQKYGITVEQLKKLHIIQRIYNLKEENISEISDNTRKEQVKKVKEALENAIKDSISNGKIDLEKVEELSCSYKIALDTGWKIKEFKKQDNNSSLFEELIKHGALPADATKENTSPEAIKEAIKTSIEKLIGKLDSNEIDKKKIQEQMQQFGVLLASSPEDEKQYFGEVIQNLHAENKTSALKILFECLKNPETRCKFADKLGENDYLEKFVEDMDQNRSVEAAALLAREQSEEGRIKAHANFNQRRNVWLESNQEQITDILNKNPEELNEQELKLLKEYHNFIIGVSTGEFIGTAENKNLSNDFREEHLSTLNKDAYELPAYKDILGNIKTYINENQGNLNIPVEELEKLLNTATKENYDRVTNPTRQNEELAAPKQATNKTSETVETFGFNQKDKPNTSKLQEIRQNIPNTEKQTRFTIDKDNATVTSPIEHSTYKNIIKNTPDYLKGNVIEKLYSTNQNFKNAIESYIKRSSNPIVALNFLPGNIRAELGGKLYNAGKIDEDDINKLNLSFDQRKQILNAKVA